MCFRRHLCDQRLQRIRRLGGIVAGDNQLDLIQSRRSPLAAPCVLSTVLCDQGFDLIGLCASAELSERSGAGAERVEASLALIVRQQDLTKSGADGGNTLGTAQPRYD